MNFKCETSISFLKEKMGKNRKPSPKSANLGRTLIKEKNNARRGIGHVKDSWVGRFIFTFQHFYF